MFASMQEVKTQDEIKPVIKINKKLGEKSGGNQHGSVLSGRYSVTLTEQSGEQLEKTALIKQEINKEKNLIEYAVSRLARVFDEKYAHLFAKVFLIPAKNIPNITKQQQRDSSPYVASIFVAEEGRAKDLWKYIYELYLTDPRFENAKKSNGHQSLRMPERRPRNLGTGEPKVVFDTVLPVLFEEYPILKTQFAHIIAMAYWNGDPDKHTENIMVRFLSDNKTIEGFSSIDFAGGFDWFDWDQTLFPIRQGIKKYGLQPTNHIKEYSRKFRITHEMAAVFEQYADVSNEKIRTEALALTSEILKITPKKDVKAFVEKLFPKSELFFVQSVNLSPDVISDQLTKKLIAKREEFKKLALEIRLSCYFIPKNRKRPEDGFICEGQNLQKLKYELKNHKNTEFEKLSFRSEGQEYHTDELRALVKNAAGEDNALETTFSMPFVPRLKYALFDIYNLNPNASFLGGAKVVFGWTDGSFLQLLKFVVFKFPYSILKLGIEFLPAMGEKFFNWASDRCLEIQKDPKASKLQIVGTSLALCLTKPLSWLCLVTRLMTMRVTSPQKSIKQALKTGESVGELLGSPRVGLLLSAVFVFASEMLTFISWCAITMVAWPYVLTLGAKIVTISSLGTKIASCLDLSMYWLVNNGISQMVTTSEMTSVSSFLGEALTFAALMIGRCIMNVIKKCSKPSEISLRENHFNEEGDKESYNRSTKSMHQNMNNLQCDSKKYIVSEILNSGKLFPSYKTSNNSIKGSSKHSSKPKIF